MGGVPCLPILACGDDRAREFGPDLSVTLVECHLGFDAAEAVTPDDGFTNVEAIAILIRRKVVVAIDAHPNDLPARPALHIEIQAAAITRLTAAAAPKYPPQ